MQPTSKTFKANVHKALNDVTLQEAMNKAKGGFIEKRRIAIEALPEFEQIKQHGRAIKEDVLKNLADYLEQFEQQVINNGGHVHWAQSPAEARAIVIDLCKENKAHSIAKGKSMIGEEINLNEALEAEGFEPIETDLGEYIIQLAGEPPSHIIAPAVHKTKAQIVELFRQHHTPLGYTKTLETVPEIVNEAREIMRDKFLQADVGITGANFIIAETGSTMIVTNEGNGDLSSTLPKTHIVLASLEKVVPTLDDCSSLLRLLARSATGQDTTTYTTFFNGPKSRPDGSQSEFHVVLVDNGRSKILHSPYRDMLRCIKCGTCMYHCPVYSNVGGHAYGWVYPGPMGSVLTPLMIGLKQSRDLPNASSFCGRCAEVCPMSIPLPDLLRQHREDEFNLGLTPKSKRWGIGVWSWLALHPRAFRLVGAMAARMLKLFSRAGTISRLPGAGNWTDSRDLPAPQGKTFMQQRQHRQAGDKS